MMLTPTLKLSTGADQAAPSSLAGTGMGAALSIESMFAQILAAVERSVSMRYLQLFTILAQK